jgi:Ni/Co efflux regulator RcnB
VGSTLKSPQEENDMQSRFTKALTALAAVGAIAVPAVAQARGGSDDPANHEQRPHQVRHHARHDRVENHRRHHRHDRAENDRRDARGSDDGPNHR